MCYTRRDGHGVLSHTSFHYPNPYQRFDTSNGIVTGSNANSQRETDGELCVTYIVANRELRSEHSSSVICQTSNLLVSCIHRHWNLEGGLRDWRKWWEIEVKRNLESWKCALLSAFGRKRWIWSLWCIRVSLRLQLSCRALADPSKNSSSRNNTLRNEI